MKAQKPIRRKKPLPRSTKPVRRSALVRRVVQKIKNKGRPRFKRGRDPQYLEWLRGLRCVLWGRGEFAVYDKRDGELARIELIKRPHRCTTPVEAAHVKSRGAGGEDRQSLPLCHEEHRAQHRMGIQSWALRWFPGGLDELRRIAAETYPQQYEKAKSLGWDPDHADER